MGVTESVIRLRRVQSGLDRYKNPVFTEEPTTIDGAFFAPGKSEESDESGRAAVVTEPTLYWRNEWPDITASDRVNVRGTIYEVAGTPPSWRGSTVGGLVVKLRTTAEGAS